MYWYLYIFLLFIFLLKIIDCFQGMCLILVILQKKLYKFKFRLKQGIEFD